tara:strand:+ start:5179 stop:5856 length:678 start_codon:yes stop_codon:yes gene_type:complete
MIDCNETQKYFKDNNYVVINNFLNKDITTLLYEYAKTKVRAIDFKSNLDIVKYDEDWDGHWNDSQAPKRFSNYGDILFDTLANLATKDISNFIGVDLVCTYSYWRMYEHGDILEKHTDRPSCKYSSTLCLGYDTSNVDEKKYPDYDWPMFVKTLDNKELPIHLKPGDLLIYRGDIVEHWRDKFLGVNHAQVFLHYNKENDKDNNHGKIDGRPLYGIPSKYRYMNY